jgi:superfamily I DNA/RNA helicase
MSTPKVHTWSPQQEAFLDWAVNGTGSCVLVAVAGAGKTTVLLEAGRRMKGEVVYMAYNKDVADETKEKLNAMKVDWRKMQAGTVHSFGFGAIRKAVSNVRVNENKVRDLLDANTPDDLKPRQGEILQLVSLAKQAAFGTAGPSIENDGAWLEMAAHFDVFDNDTLDPDMHVLLIEQAKMLLKLSNRTLAEVDYDDMVYLPVLHKLPFWRKDVIMVDEAQDTNPARRALVRAMVKKGGRVIAVGDPAQAIYGFTGADSNAIELIKRDFNAIELPLTITYRCPKAVVAVAQQWVSHISAADTAPEGVVDSITYESFPTRNDLNGRGAVLCRLNKPLTLLAFSLLRRRIPCRIMGRDIGGSLKKLLQRWKVKELDALEGRLEKWLQQQTTRLLAKKQESRVAVIEDQVETCKVIIDACRAQGKYTVADAVAWVDSMFVDKVEGDILTLSSIHKSKGREWKHVYWLDRAGTCPSKWARQDWQQEQERNLMYVCATRAQEQLTDIVMEAEEPAPKESSDADHE